MEIMNTSCSACKNCVCCYQRLRWYILLTEAYHVIGLGYKFLFTLSVTQVACERSFSTLKFTKHYADGNLKGNPYGPGYRWCHWQGDRRTAVTPADKRVGRAEWQQRRTRRNIDRQTDRLTTKLQTELQTEWQIRTRRITDRGTVTAEKQRQTAQQG